MEEDKVSENKVVDFKKEYSEIKKLLPEDPKQLEFLYQRMVTLIKFAVERAEYYENIRQKRASASNTLIGLAFTGLGLVTTIVIGTDWIRHPATYLFIPPLLVLLVGGLLAKVIHQRDSTFKYPHEKYTEVEERWYYKQSIPASERLLETGADTEKMHTAFISDLRKEFERDENFDRKEEIFKDKETLVILYIVTAYKKKFANRITKYHTGSFNLAVIVMIIFAAFYFFVLPFIP